jgi:hypothetical protein
MISLDVDIDVAEGVGVVVMVDSLVGVVVTIDEVVEVDVVVVDVDVVVEPMGSCCFNCIKIEEGGCSGSQLMIDIARVVAVEVGDTLLRVGKTRERARDEGMHRCCQYQMCEDRNHHEPCEPESEGAIEKASLYGHLRVVCARVNEMVARIKLSTSGAN